LVKQKIHPSTIVNYLRGERGKLRFNPRNSPGQAVAVQPFVFFYVSMSCKGMFLVVIIVKDPALGSSHKRLINISLHVVGRLEYWNTGILGQNSERCLIWEY